MARRRRTRKVEQAYEFEVYPPGTLRLDDVDLSIRVKGDEKYEAELKRRQHEVFGLQVAMFQGGRRAIFVFEGWDAAGKGGAIKRLTAEHGPARLQGVAHRPPDEESARHHYLWRFWNRLPALGRDRGLRPQLVRPGAGGARRGLRQRRRSGQRAYDEINAFERMLTADGVRMTKFFLHIDQKTQLERFKARETDPFKNYKIGPDDWRNRRKWKDYETAIEEMFDRTHRPDAPWVLDLGQRQAPRAARGAPGLRRRDGLHARGAPLSGAPRPPPIEP